METVASNPPDSAWKASLGLSTRRPPELYEKSEQVGNAPHAGALRTAFDDLGLSAVFCVEHVPTVAVLVGAYDPGAVATLHAALSASIDARPGAAGRRFPGANCSISSPGCGVGTWTTAPSA